jgi:hypothetical protein
VLALLSGTREEPNNEAALVTAQCLCAITCSLGHDGPTFASHQLRKPNEGGTPDTPSREFLCFISDTVYLFIRNSWNVVSIKLYSK